MSAKTIFGRRKTATITPGGFTPTRQRNRPAGYWEKHKETKASADRALLVYQRTVRVK